MTQSLPTIPDHSFLSDTAHCQRLAYYKYERGLESVEPGSPPMIAGSAGHAGLAALYADEPIEEAIGKMHEYLDRNELKAAGRYDYLTSGHMEVVLRNYYDHWRDKEPYTIIETIEEPIVADIGVGFEVGGIPDLIVQDGEGAYLALDHKFTAGYIGSRLYNRTKFTHQLRTYALLTRAKFGIHIQGGVVNAIYMGKHATSSTTKATLFDRWRFDWTAEQLAETREWIRQTNGRFTDLIDQPESVWLQNGGSHCGWCQFQELCSSPPALRENRIRTNFRVRDRTGRLISGADSD